MSAFDVPQIDDETENHWRLFTRELADAIANSEPGSELSIQPVFVPEGFADRSMLIRPTATGTFICAATGLDDPGEPWRCTEVSTVHVVEEEASWVDRLAATLVVHIRESWSVPHPSFLRGWKPSAPAAHIPTHNRSTPAGSDEEPTLAELVGETLTSRFDNVVESSHAVFHVQTGPTLTTLSVNDADEVCVHACIVERIGGRTRAAELVNDLNRLHSRVKFVLVEDRVHVTISVDARPFVAQHILNAFDRIVAFASTIDEVFADNMGGVLAAESVVTMHVDDTGEEVPPPVMTLLEVDAESGSVGAHDVVAVCGRDRETVATYEAFCSEQAESWRDCAREARDRGEVDVAASCEREALPWDRVVTAFRAALRTVGFFDNA